MVENDELFDVNFSWRWLLQDVLIARNAHLVGNMQPAVASLVWETVLPTTYYIRTVSFFDESLAFFIDSKDIKTHKKSNTLDAKLKLLSENGHLDYSQKLRDIKDRRNQLAHRSTGPETYFDLSASWKEVDDALDAIEATLQKLGLVGERPEFEFYWARDVDLYPDAFHPDKPGVRATYNFTFGVKEAGEEVLTFSKSYDNYAVGYASPSQS